MLMIFVLLRLVLRVAIALPIRPVRPAVRAASWPDSFCRLAADPKMVMHDEDVGNREQEETECQCAGQHTAARAEVPLVDVEPGVDDVVGLARRFEPLVDVLRPGLGLREPGPRARDLPGLRRAPRRGRTFGVGPSGSWGGSVSGGTA